MPPLPSSLYSFVPRWNQENLFQSEAEGFWYFELAILHIIEICCKNITHLTHFSMLSSFLPYNILFETTTRHTPYLKGSDHVFGLLSDQLVTEECAMLINPRTWLLLFSDLLSKPVTDSVGPDREFPGFHFPLLFITRPPNMISFLSTHLHASHLPLVLLLSLVRFCRTHTYHYLDPFPQWPWVVGVAGIMGNKWVG